MSNSRRLTIGQNIDSGESGGGSISTSNYMTILALENGLTASLSANACQYCIDGDGNWIDLPAGTTTQAINSGQTLSFRGNLTPNSSNGIGTFTISKKCNLEGNCMSMLFGDEAAENDSLSGKNYAFRNLFSGCTTIVQVSETFLPATTLASYCYQYMFYGCTSLTVAPELPATTLASDCYWSMFYNCTSLTTGPSVLPATTLVSSCYRFMFNGCSSLTVAPELPATTLASYCYQYMFNGCSSLTVAPELPATTLASYCYNYMFYNCTSLTVAPELPATTLASYCYADMFNGCSNLNYIKMLATDISASSCLSTWVYNVASTGTFVKNPAMTSLSTGNRGIPKGWTVVDDTTYSIIYTSSYGNIVTPHRDNVFGANIVSNTYVDGQGIISFDGPVTKIGSNVFYDSNLISITIPDSVTIIEDTAFQWSSLNNITIGTGVTSIGKNAFNNCGNLRHVYCKPATPPTVDDGAFTVTSLALKFYVPTNSVDAYKNANVWKYYASQIVGYDFEND